MKTKILILAAGIGKRMASETPKVLLPVAEKPMIFHLLDTVRETGINGRPVVVVGNKAEGMQKILGDQCEYVVQKEQLGTGHAVMCAEKALRGKANIIFVLYGDQPCIESATIKKILALHEKEQPEITMATTIVENFNDWRKPLNDFGRIVLDEKGKIQASVERKDATPEQIKIRELNPSFYCFKADWLWENLKKIDKKNAQGEYYLTDLVRIAIDQGKRVETVDVNPLETLGVNTQEHL